MSMCLCMQCSKKSANPAEPFFSFVIIAFVYLVSIAFSGSWVGNGEHLQPSAAALFVAACTCLYFVTYAGWGQSYMARFS